MCYQFINEIPSDLFSELQQIGSGSFSTIFSAIHNNTNTPVALKVSLKTDENDKIQIIRQELIVHKSLNHPFICKYYTDIETEHLIIVVMEFIEGINLLEYVNKSKGLQIQDIKKLFAQIIIVIEYLHNEQNISHRDLKLENIMVDNYGNIRLIDFGFSSSKRIMSTLCGSIPYCAPEVLQCENYSKRADIWCLGVILYSLVYKNLPFYDTNIAKLANIICNNEPTYPLTEDPNLHDLLTKLLMKDPCQRISIDDIKNHPFMADVKILQINYRQLFSPVQPNLQIFKRRSESKIKLSQSHPNIQKSPNKGLPHRNSNLFLPHITTQIDHPPISNLHSIVTENSENFEDLILSRKDYSKKLNELIESALSIDSHNFFYLNDSRNRFQTVKPVHFNFHNVVIRRNSHSQSALKQFPQIAKPI